MECEEVRQMVSAPAMIVLGDDDVLFTVGKGLSTTTVFLKPTEIRDEFTLERINAGEFGNFQGKTIYQDYMLIKPFKGWEFKMSIGWRLALPEQVLYDGAFIFY